jgi:membrane-associated PAP2 superfamily phosphatase
VPVEQTVVVNSRSAVAAPERAVWVALGIGLAVLLGLEATTIDLALARPFFDAVAGDFRWREHGFFTRVSHDGLRLLSGAVLLWLLVGLWRPLGVLRRLPPAARLYLVANVALCLIALPLLKRASWSHCPWDLALFGGHADYLRLLQWPGPQDTRGRCLPAGHALSAFAYAAGWFALRAHAPVAARGWLAAVLLFGAWAGLAQQARGAHFLSHTLWSLWLCFALAALTAFIVARRTRPQ